MHTDCADGYCVEPLPGEGGQCTRTCNDDCPTGWDCIGVTFPTGTIKLCVPNAARQCLACVADSECPGGDCLTIDGSGHCAATCADSSTCPTGYSCVADATGAHTGKFCQPNTGSCSCNAANQGMTRACANGNSFGTCYGMQTCDAANGWSTCNAKVPAAETCNGVDDNCDFVIDNNVPGVGGACSISNSYGTCTGVETCMGAQGIVCNGQTPMMEMCNGIDDNCNSMIDEGFAGLGNACTAGVGQCLRYGAITCNANGTGTQCGAVAGNPTAELCNHLDDDCDGTVDEDFTMLGQACTAGMGQCLRYGTYVCANNAQTCSAMPGSPTTETCNYLDDDCNGIVDDGYRDPNTGLYLGDMNCGTCGNNCLTQYTANQSHGVCNATAHCVMTCNANYFDLDGSTNDGCEFTLDATAIYVSGDDAMAADDTTCGLGPVGTGTGNHPCKTIGYGIGRASATSRSRVNVANATYNEAVTLVAGKSLYGGYAGTTWQRDLANTSTVIQGVAMSGAHAMTVIANNITSATTFEGFVVRGPENSNAGGNSYAVYISASSNALTIDKNQIFAGRGAPGGAGGAGTNGLPGVAGGPYSAATYNSYQAGTNTVQCVGTNARGAYGGGARTCGATAVNGGNGGGENCTPSRSTQNSTATAPATAGNVGGGFGGGTAGAAGSRGYDGQQGAGTPSTASTCYVPVTVQGNILPMFGGPGSPGGNGSNAAAVNGCITNTGSVSGGHWVAGGGANGFLGSNGGGGGGGGAGGGGDCVACSTGNGSDQLGGHGGGGGAGGCGGTGGSGGGGGGGAFAIFVTGGTAPTITGNTIQLGAGGAGGIGGIAGAGGLGGIGSQGGQTGTFFCTGKGGDGGNGGNGGAGSGGGGGCGGNSYGIFTSGVGTPTYCTSNTLSGGTAGAAGPGGYSGGNSGGGGTAGLVSQCTSI